jgi:hypothetical protein
MPTRCPVRKRAWSFVQTGLPGRHPAPNRGSVPVGTNAETRTEGATDIAFEYAMLVLVGIPVCSVLCALALVLCLICLPFVALVSPFLYLSHRRRVRATHHPLSDRSLGVVPESVVPGARRPGQAEQVAPGSTGWDRPG